MTSQALILGLTGNAGQAIASALHQRGWALRALHRQPDVAARSMQTPPDLRWLQGDAMNASDVRTAARGCNLLVHAVNPAGYRHWRELAIPMLANSIAAARDAGARLLLPGNLYNYGPEAWPELTEQSPQHPISRKGQVRQEMEQMLATAAARHGVRSLVVRAGDFFGGRGNDGWMERVLVKPGRPVRSVTYPGDPETGHSWAYLPDLGETVARLVEREASLATFDTVHFTGHYLPRGIEMAETIAHVAGRNKVRIRRLPWPLLRAMGVFDPTCRELMEMRYLWFEDIRLDNHKLRDLLGEEPHTPLEDAVKSSLDSMGCLAEGPEPGAVAPGRRIR